MSCSVDIRLTVSATTLHRHNAGTATEPILPKDETKLTTLFAASLPVPAAAPQGLHA